VTTLHDLNREEWADKPYLIELRGGRVDGQRFHWHQLLSVWRQPEPAPVDLTLDPSVPLYPMAIPVAQYRETGSVTDDGAHIYEFECFE
jgi:hypothetical protein